MPDVREPSAHDALQRVLDQARQQLELIEATRGRPDADLAGLTRTAFEMTLKAMRASATTVASDAALPAAQREQARAFVDAVDRYERGAVRLGQHLIAMAADWSCPKCGSDVARTAALSGVDLGKGFVKLELICASCGAASAPTPRGRKVFEDKFGHLVREGWNPEQSGFQWDRR